MSEDDIVTRLRGAADAAARTLSGNSMMPPEMSGLGDAESEDLVFLCRDASDRIEALEAEVERLTWRLVEAKELLIRAQLNVPGVYQNWHDATGKFLGFTPTEASLEQRLRDAGVETENFREPGEFGEGATMRRERE